MLFTYIDLEKIEQVLLRWSRNVGKKVCWQDLGTTILVEGIKNWGKPVQSTSPELENLRNKNTKI